MNVYFFILDSLLPTRPGGDRPSRSQFEHSELLPLRDHFAAHWDDGLGLIPDPVLPDTKWALPRGRLVMSYAVRGHLLSDDETIELDDIRIDFEGLPDLDVD